LARLGSSDTTAWRGQSSVDKYSVPDRSPQANSTMPSGQRSRLCREYARSAARFLTAAALRGRAATGCGLLVARVRGGAGLGGGHPGHDTGAPHPYTFGAVCRRTTPASLQGTTAELSAKLGCARAQERNVKYPNGGQEASRVTAAARRKLGSLGSAVENLRELLNGPQCADACAPSSALRARSRLQSRGGGSVAASAASCCRRTAKEKNRRRDLIANLRLQREQVLQSLKRDSHTANRCAPRLFASPPLAIGSPRQAACLAGCQQPGRQPGSAGRSRRALADAARGRASLLETGGAAPGAAGRETLRTADVDNRGLVQLQQTVMREQDAELEELERSVTSTKARPLAAHGPDLMHARPPAPRQCVTASQDGKLTLGAARLTNGNG